jgi:hypothetical protein
MVMSIRHFAEFLPPAGPPPQPVPTNLALNSLGVTALASSVYSGGPSYYALNAYDADDSSANRWNSDITIPVGEWLGVDLGSSKLISKFRVFQFTAGTYTFASDFTPRSPTTWSTATRTQVRVVETALQVSVSRTRAS